MYTRLFLFLASVLISTSGIAFAGSDSSTAYTSLPYTLQVAAFPSAELADKLVIRLVAAGEHPACSTVELEGRGYWTRVFVGLFTTSAAARSYGENLVARGIVNDFLVRMAVLNQDVTRPRRVAPDRRLLQEASNQITSSSSRNLQVALNRNSLATTAADRASHFIVSAKPKVRVKSVAYLQETSEFVATPLPEFRAGALELVPCVDTEMVPRPDPVSLALRLVVGGSRHFPSMSSERGGLWISGDIELVLERLRWIVGRRDAELVKVSDSGRIQIDKRLLARSAGLGSSRVEDPLQVADYISSNEGLLLLVQLAEGDHRYRIHMGRHVPTRGKNIEIAGSINLDNNFDSRINKYRKDGRKLDTEQPPEGFDSLVALNPVARWFNLSANNWVHSGEILFHEMAEAYAKLEMGLDYLEQGSKPGAHNLAVERERRLSSQRPDAEIVLTAGSNRVLRTEEEIRLFYASGPGGSGQR